MGYCLWDLQLCVGNDADEFSVVLKKDRIPKILITTCRFNSSVCLCNRFCFFSVGMANLLWTLFIWDFGRSQRGPAFIRELLSVIPNAHYYKRGTYELKKVLAFFFSCGHPNR